MPPSPLHSSGASTIQQLKQALILAEEALDKKSMNPVLLEVTNLVSYADYLLILTAGSAAQSKAISEACIERAKELGLEVVSKEGLGSGRWVLLDFGDVVVHVFQPNERTYYDLEALWVEAPRIEIPGADEATDYAPIFAS